MKKAPEFKVHPPHVQDISVRLRYACDRERWVLSTDIHFGEEEALLVILIDNASYHKHISYEAEVFFDGESRILLNTDDWYQGIHEYAANHNLSTEEAQQQYANLYWTWDMAEVAIGGVLIRAEEMLRRWIALGYIVKLST